MADEGYKEAYKKITGMHSELEDDDEEEEDEEELSIAEQVSQKTGYLSAEVVQAYMDSTGNNDPTAEEVEYQGHFQSDEGFAEQLCEDIGYIPRDFPSFIHIDWEWTAKEIMMDYFESDGYYFRNL
jgi:hypothetical protein